MARQFLTCLFFLSVLFSPFSLQAESTLPLKQQIVPEFSQPLTSDANKKVERIFLTAYQHTYLQLRFAGKYRQASSLLNAPISGKSERRGRNLLTFAAFGGFKNLAKWGLDQGSDINRGDWDNATMLRMAVSNKLEYMAEYALRHGANPNLLQGDSLDNTFGDMMRFGWPLSGFQLAWRHGARLRNNGQQQELEVYLLRPDSDTVSVSHFLDILSTPFATIPGDWPEVHSKRATRIDTVMIDVMDQALLNAINQKTLVRHHIEQFNVNGMSLPHFLAFNGMAKSLMHILLAISPEEARSWISRPDRTGNNLIIAVIKSLSPVLLEEVLTLSSDSINEAVPDEKGYYSIGNTPLHIAVQWQAPDAIFDALFRHGAEKSLDIKNLHGMTPEQMLKDWFSNSKHYQRIKNKLESARPSASNAGEQLPESDR